jgi:excisionase family DNA binding protein
VTTIPDTTPLLMSLRKTEQVFGVSKTKLYKWIEEGRLRARLVGSHMRIHRDDLLAMIDQLPCVGD